MFQIGNRNSKKKGIADSGELGVPDFVSTTNKNSTTHKKMPEVGRHASTAAARFFFSFFLFNFTAHSIVHRFAYADGLKWVSGRRCDELMTRRR